MIIKYQVWYDQIVDRARDREIPKCYTELHHIKPRAFGGSDDISNLVRLTYREHFLVHWILTKTCAGRELRQMQRAFFAMTLPCSKHRIISSWQFDAAKRAIRDLELDPIVEAAWHKRYLVKKAEQKSKDRDLQYFARIGRRHERDANKDLVMRLSETGRLDKSNAREAAHLLLHNNKGASRTKFKVLGLSASQANAASMRAWRTRKSAPLAKKTKIKLESILGYCIPVSGKSEGFENKAGWRGLRRIPATKQLPVPEA